MIIFNHLLYTFIQISWKSFSNKSSLKSKHTVQPSSVLYLYSIINNILQLMDSSVRNSWTCDHQNKCLRIKFWSKVWFVRGLYCVEAPKFLYWNIGPDIQLKRLIHVTELVSDAKNVLIFINKWIFVFVSERWTIGK